MSYAGSIATIPLGQLGLVTDDSQSSLPPQALVLAENVRLQKGLIEKDRGTRQWNAAGTTLASGIVGLLDWHPNTIRQRWIVAERSGRISRFIDSETNETISPSDSSAVLLTIDDNQVSLVEGGLEVANNAKKVFIFTGNEQVQVISDDGNTRRAISNPAADWANGDFPRFGLIHNGRLVAFGNDNDPHRIYMSDPDDHENFVNSAARQFSVFPGEGDRLLSGITYKGRLFLFKRRGAYYLDDSQVLSTDWRISKLSNSFGIASANSAIQVLDDLLIKNQTGSITSLAATDAFGDIESGDVLNSLRVEDFIAEITTQAGTPASHAIYYEDQKVALFTYQQTTDTKPNMILYYDVAQQTPRVTVNLKEQPNVLAMRRDSLGTDRPFYGAEDGNIYELDRETRVDGSGAAYTGKFRTTNLDFSFLDPTAAERDKIFQWLQIQFEETGNYSLSVRVFIDNLYVETLTYRLTKNEYADGNLELDVDQIIGRTAQSQRLPLHGSGKRISFECSNGGSGENFRISGLVIGFKVAGEGEKA